MNSPQYPAGWHAIPNSNQERYWDGTQWTDAYRPIATSVSVPVVGVVQASTAPNHGPAIASMVLGICSLVIWYAGIVTGIIGLVLGAVSLKHCQPRGPKRGRGMAIAGITCSIIALALWLIVIIVVANAASSVSDY